MYPELFRKMIFPMMEIYHGTNIQKNLSWLNSTQWWPIDRIRELQNKKLRMLIKYSYNNIPYYHKIFKELKLQPGDIGCVDDLCKLPILTKEDIKLNHIDLRPIGSSKYPMNWSSSGSTGEPVQFFRDKNDLSMAWAAAFRAWNWAGYEIGTKYITIWGAPVTLANQKKYINRIKNYMRRNTILSAYDITNENIIDYLKVIKYENPKIIRGYSQAIFLLAKYMETRGINGLNPSAILTTAESLFDHQRKIIEKQFGCPVFDGYGGGEAPSAAYECEEHRGYHISAENMVIEFIKDGEHVAPGETGKIVITNLNSFAMPFIRYDMGDMGKPSSDLCSCGRGLPMMESIEGRVNDFITAPNGKLIHSYFFSALFKNIVGVDQFQVIQEKIDKLYIKIVINDKFTDNDSYILRREILNNVGIEAELEFVNEISLSERSGKRRFIRSEVPIKF